MTEETPAIPGSDTPDDASYQAAIATSWVALAFCLVVLGLLVANLAIGRASDPLQAAQIELLKTKLATDPGNDPLREQVRELDLELRTTYSVTRARAIRGTYLLVLGVVVFLVALHAAAKCRARLPTPSPEAAGTSWADAALGLRSVAALGLLMAGFLLTMVVLGRHDASAEYIKAAREAAREDNGSPAGAAAGPSPVASTRPAAQVVPQPVVPAPAPPGPALAVAPGVPQPVAGGPAGGRQLRTQCENPPRVAPTPPAPEAAPQPSPPAVVPDPSPLAGEEWARNWPVFRGPAAGTAAAGDFPTEWDAATGQGIMWKTPVPLPGNSSPVFWDGRVFLTGADEKQCVVYCFDGATGDALWEQNVATDQSAGGEPPEVLKETGYAAPTMATNSAQVFAMFASGDVAAFDLEGKSLWAKALGTPDNVYGHAASLAVYRDLLIVQFDQGADAEAGLSALLALDATTGREVWRTDRPVPNSWSSPIVINSGARDEIITCADPWVISYDAGTGQELWRTECLSGDIGPSACYAAGLVLACSEQGGLFAIRPAAANPGAEPEVVWSAEEGVPDTASPACNGELVFLLASYGVVTCYSVTDGAKVWEHDLEGSYDASPVVVGSHVYVADTDGVIHIFKAGREFVSVGTGTLDEPVHATPAFVGGMIYIRGEQHLYCVGRGEAAE